MSNPSIDGSSITAIKQYVFSVKLDAATAQNLLANKASSTALITGIDVYVHNIDGTNSANISMTVYNQDGTGICSNTGTGEASTSTDVVAGTDLGGYTTITIPSGETLILCQNWALNEDQSLVVTASAANDLAVWVKYTVIT